PGDEILTSNHEHFAGRAALAIARDRRRIVIREVVLPVGNDQCAEMYVDRFSRGITPRTRVLFFSSPTATTGTLLPIRMLAELGQRHGLIIVVDAAHIPGMIHCSFRETGVDFLAGSGNKWQCAPAGTGILYVRNRVSPNYNPLPLTEFWPVISVWY